MKMRQQQETAQQLNPLLPGYSFNVYLVAGTTPIIENGPLDFFIDRRKGMSGFIINMTVKGRGKVFDGDDAIYCNPGDLLLFPPEATHFYGRAPDSPDWYHRWIYFRPRAYWSHWLEWRNQVNNVGRLTLLDQALITEFDELFQQIEQTYKSGRRSSEELAINLLERLLIRCFEETPEHRTTPIDQRINEACQYLSRNLAEEVNLDKMARHVCLSPSRLAHLFREQMGVNIVRWREDQRMILAKHLLQSTRSPIAKIASLVGYDDQMYFSRVFRKRVGASPSEFRRNSEAPPANCEVPLAETPENDANQN
jgi:AraC family transcriptional regulator, arabinose operon regulatory protein